MFFHRDRTASYLAALSQTPACGFPAQGSSVLLASHILQISGSLVYAGMVMVDTSPNMFRRDDFLLFKRCLKSFYTNSICSISSCFFSCD